MNCRGCGKILDDTTVRLYVHNHTQALCTICFKQRNKPYVRVAVYKKDIDIIKNMISFDKLLT